MRWREKGRQKERRRGERHTGIVRHRCDSEVALGRDLNSQEVGGSGGEVKQMTVPETDEKL